MYTPETESEFIIDQMISVPLDTDKNESYDFYVAVAKDLGQAPLELNEYNNKIAQFRAEANKGSRASQYRNSKSPSLWEFMLANHDIDLTSLVDDKDNRRNIVVEENGYLTVRIPNVDGKFKLETLNLFKGLTAKQTFTTTKEFGEYKGAIEEQKQRLKAHRIYKHSEEPRLNKIAKEEKERRENLTTFVVSDYSESETQEQPTNEQTSYGIITSSFDSKTKDSPKQPEFSYTDLPIKTVRKPDKGYLGDFVITVKNGERVVVRELPIMAGFTTKNGSIDLEIPVLVPTLTSDEILKTLEAAKRNEMPPAKVLAKAQKHALERIKKGLSPFYTSENNTSFSYNKQHIENLQKEFFE